MHQLEDWVFNRKSKKKTSSIVSTVSIWMGLIITWHFLYELVIYNWLGTTLIDPITLYGCFKSSEILTSEY